MGKILVGITISLKPHALDIDRMIKVLERVKQRFAIQNASTNFENGMVIIKWTESLEIDRGFVSKSAGKLDSQGVEQSAKKRSKDRELQDSNIKWVHHSSFNYATHEGKLLIRVVKNGKTQWSRAFEYNAVKQLYERLPDESYIEDIIKTAEEVKLDITRSVARFFMHIFANYVDFDAELIKDPKDKRRIKLVKQNYSLRDETRKRLKQELEVIGKIYDETEV